MLLEEIKNVLRAEMKTVLRNGLISGVSIDSRTVAEGELFVAVRGEQFDGHDFIDEVACKGVSAVVVDRKMQLSDAVKDNNVNVLKVADTVRALGELARFYRSSIVGSVCVIGVTGSNGKTTVREMIYHVLSKYKKGCRSPRNYNNNIGVPLTLFGIESEHEFAVVEIGSNAPGEVSALSRIAGPNIAVITNVGLSHLEGLKDIEGVIAEKASIVVGLKKRGLIVCGADDEKMVEKLRALSRPMITYGLKDDCDVNSIDVQRENGGFRYFTNDRCEVVLGTTGLHNVKNSLAALAVARRLGISSQQFAEAIKDFEPVVGRMNSKDVNGITIIDDTYNANPESVRVAMDELIVREDVGRRVLVLGDMAELGPDSKEYHRQLGKRIAGSNIDILLTVGPMAAETAKTALESGMGRSQIQKAINSKRLARLAKPLIRNGDVILVKGSRSMQMEKVVESLERWRGRRAKSEERRAKSEE